MELLFGSMQDVARFVVAFMLVLGLIGAGALLWRRFGVGPLSPIGPRGRQPRLAVIDVASVDVRRRLVLIRRDNTEHLLMIGGPTDIVIEPGITRTGTMPMSREPRPIPVGDSSRQPGSTESPGWTLPVEQPTRTLRAVEDLDAPLEPPSRTAREAMADSMRAVRPELAVRRSPAAELRTPPEDEIAAPALTPPPLPAEANYRASTVLEPRRASTPSQPPPYEPVFQATAPEAQRPPAVPEPTSHFSAAEEAKRAPGPPPRQSQSDENNLAEMAQRLEAALRRPTKPVEPPAAPPTATRPAKPVEPPAMPPASVRPTARPEPSATRKAAQFEAPNPPKASKSPEPFSSPPADLKILSGKAKGDPQPPFESLEDEMAKMLGRSPGKS